LALRQSRVYTRRPSTKPFQRRPLERAGRGVFGGCQSEGDTLFGLNKVLDSSLRRDHDAREKPSQKNKFQLRSPTATTPEAKRKPPIGKTSLIA